MNHFQETWNAFAFSIIVNIEMQLKSSYVEDKDPSVLHIQLTGIDLGAYAANESRRYIITTSLIGWAHNETDSCDTMDADNQGLFSLSGRTSYRKISWCFEAARFGLVFSNRYGIWQARGSNAAEVPVEYQSDKIIITFNLTASRLHEILR